jgi:hypothetical protein
VLSTLDDLNFKDDQSMLAAFESELKHISSDVSQIPLACNH